VLVSQMEKYQYCWNVAKWKVPMSQDKNTQRICFMLEIIRWRSGWRHSEWIRVITMKIMIITYDERIVPCWTTKLVQCFCTVINNNKSTKIYTQDYVMGFKRSFYKNLYVYLLEVWFFLYESSFGFMPLLCFLP